ncbi:Mobile element protein, partial [hydrothermal vent metagenome]
KPDRVRYVDYAYERGGTANLFMLFAPLEGWRLVERFEWHYTPKHGSWLDMAETELSVLSRQCLNRRIGDKENLEAEVKAWQAYRNKHNAKADWHFSNQTARVKLKHLYPAI